jgi:hypothetical protein
VSKAFRTIAIDPVFYDKVGLIVVDGAHWAKAFGQIMRGCTNCAPFSGRFACSATLDNPTLNIRDLGMLWQSSTTLLIGQSLSINYQIAFIPNKAGSSALRFLFDVNSSPVLPQKQIPKTVVFFDTKKEAIAARDLLSSSVYRKGNEGYNSNL